MKKILILLISVLFILPVYGQQQAPSCQLAYPMMEVLKCEKADKFTKTEYFSCSGSSCSINYICVSDCTLTLHIECGALSRLEGKVLVDGELRRPFDILGITSTNIDLSDMEAGDGESITINANCERLFIDQPLDKDKSFAVISDSQKYLFATNHEWSSHKLDDTVNCIPQSRVSNFMDKQIISGNLPNVYYSGGTDILGNLVKSSENFVDISKVNLQSELKVGDTISYFYRWEIVSDINLKYDENINPVYCGGSSDQRKLFSYNEIKTAEACYYIPSTISKQVECCLDGDCRFTGQVCGPGFKCTDKKPCNSDFECGTQEPQCSDNQLSSWACDKSQGQVNMPDGQTYAGWCSKQTKNVLCCPNSCQTGFHCEYDKGCVTDIRILDCPQGKCCKAGGNYKEKGCDSGLECCSTIDPILGECKESCAPPTTLSSTDTGASNTPGSPNPNLQPPAQGLVPASPTGILGILAITAIVLVGAGGYLYMTKYGNPIGKKKFCTKCGSPMTSKFCTNCGSS